MPLMMDGLRNMDQPQQLAVSAGTEDESIPDRDLEQEIQRPKLDSRSAASRSQLKLLPDKAEKVSVTTMRSRDRQMQISHSLWAGSEELLLGNGASEIIHPLCCVPSSGSNYWVRCRFPSIVPARVVSRRCPTLASGDKHPSQKNHTHTNRQLTPRPKTPTPRSGEQDQKEIPGFGGARRHPARPVFLPSPQTHQNRPAQGGRDQDIGLGRHPVHLQLNARLATTTAIAHTDHHQTTIQAVRCTFPAMTAAVATSPRTLSITVEFSGGLEMLFANQRSYELEIPASDKDGQPATIAYLIDYLCEHVMEDSRKDLFVLDSHLRPGILVLINDADWELEGEEAYEVQSGDSILFVSTLHGG